MTLCMRKFLEKNTKKWWKFERVCIFLLPFLLKNYYFRWIKEEPPKIKITIFDGLRVDTFFKTFGVWGWVGRLYKSLQMKIWENFHFSLSLLPLQVRKFLHLRAIIGCFWRTPKLHSKFQYLGKITKFLSTLYK